MVGLGADFHSLCESRSSNREQHELLEGQLVSSMRTTVDDVECGGRKNVGWLDTSKLGQVLVKWDTLFSSGSFGDGNANAQDGIGSEFTLVRGTIKLDKEVIDVLLGGDLEARLNQLGGNDVVNIGNGLRDACAGVTGAYLRIFLRGCSPFPT